MPQKEQVRIQQKKDTARRILSKILPAGFLSALQNLWRKFYWWKRYRISTTKNAKTIASLLISGRPIKLELGSSRRDELPDWIASDINGGGDIQLDLLQPIPFPDNSVDVIYTSHLLEHFSYPSPLRGLLQECYRILKPGGVMSVAVPNARIFLNAYNQPESFDWKAYCTEEVGLKFTSKIDYVNFIAYLGGEHKHLFDEENLVEVLLDSGFAKATVRDFDSSIDLQRRRHESIYAQAVK